MGENLMWLNRLWAEHMRVCYVSILESWSFLIQKIFVKKPYIFKADKMMNQTIEILKKISLKSLM